MRIVKDKAKKLAEMQQKKELPFARNEKDGIKTNSVMNIMLILLNDLTLKGIFKFNEFTDEIDLVRNQKLKLSKGMPDLTLKKGQYEDTTTDSIEAYIETSQHITFKNNLIEQAIGNVARANAYNPVIDYFEKCLKNWDKKSRLNSFFPIYLGAEKSQTTELITLLWFMGAVAKTYNPLTKFDYVLDLVGGQGAGKTTLLQKIAPLGLYTDQFTDFSNKDNFEVMRNALIVNDDEMTASNKVSFEEVKKFITMQKFEYRKSYGHKVSRFYKKFVIARTTNEIRHLKDKSGDRRFISIMVNPKRQEKHPVTDLTQEYVDQLWGEAVWFYKNTKNPFELSQHENILLQKNREQFMYTTALEDDLNDRLDNIFYDKTFISNEEMAYELFHAKDGFNSHRKEAREIRYYMEHKGWETGIKKKNSDGSSTRGFRKSSR